MHFLGLALIAIWALWLISNGRAQVREARRRRREARRYQKLADELERLGL